MPSGRRIRRSVGSLQAVAAVPVKFHPGIGDNKTRFTGDVLWFKGRRDVVVDNCSAPFADEVDMLRQIAVVTVFHPVKLQLFDQAAF